MSETAVSYAFEQLVPAAPVADGLAVAHACAEAEEIRELARSEGYADGRAAGYGEGLAEASSAAHALSEALTAVRALREEVSVALERDAVEFALALAEKILAGALQAKPDLVAEVVQDALRRIGERHKITVLVNPSDLESVRSALGDPRDQGPTEHCDVQGDPGVRPGGAIARTAEGELDASVYTQLERARELALNQIEAAVTVA